MVNVERECTEAIRLSRRAIELRGDVDRVLLLFTYPVIQGRLSLEFGRRLAFPTLNAPSENVSSRLPGEPHDDRKSSDR